MGAIFLGDNFPKGLFLGVFFPGDIFPRVSSIWIIIVVRIEGFSHILTYFIDMLT